MAQTLRTAARKLLKLRDEAAKAKKAKDKADEALAAQQRLVYDLMEGEGLPSVTIDLGGKDGVVQLGRRTKVFSRVFNLDKLIEALKAEGRLEEAIKSDVRKAPLNELVRERLETGEPLPEGLDFSQTPYIQVTRKKG